MNRSDLLEKLELVAPALSNNNLVPVLSHFWFKPDVLMAYNDQIAISTKLSCDFSAAVPSTLISLLTASRAKEIELQLIADSNLQVKAASSKFKLPYIASDALKIFEMPKPNKKEALPVDIKEFLEALDCCMRSLKEDTSMPDSLGITLVYNNKGIDLYATNDATISYARVKVKEELDDFRVVISGNFCRQMLALSKLEGAKHIEVHDDYSIFQCGDNLLFGRLVDVARPLDFDSVIAESFPKEAHRNLAAIPTKLELILDRAVIITESKQERPKTAITVEAGIVKFFSQSENGEVRDSMQVEEQHPDVEISIDPRLFKNGYGGFDKFLLTENCLIMSKGSSLYLVSAAH